MSIPVPLSERPSRRTTSDDVFARLHADIVSLKLPPGTRLSEVDVARQLEVSRQPVREAFIRLNDLDLLRVQPQRATEVRRISKRALLNARFIRTAVEIEVLRVACVSDVSGFDRDFEDNLAGQAAAAEAGDTARFHALDYAFHRLLCEAADHAFAYETVARHKSQIDRLCYLSLTEIAEMRSIHADHAALHAHVRAGREREAVALIRRHLSRLVDLVDGVMASHPDYFGAD